MRDRIYMDYAATTPLSPVVLEAMMPYLTGCYGNPSSIHGTGREAQKQVDFARRQVAEAIGAQPQEIFFTAGGTESDNWAMKGIALAARNKGNHIITSAVEHHAILHTAQWLEKQGFELTYLPVDKYGRVDPETVEQAITDRTVLISVMTANNEIGTIQPIAEIGSVAGMHHIPFHTDAVQAIGSIPVRVDDLHVDLLSLSAHKFYGPKGVGSLYIRSGTQIESLIHGGAQERGHRAGTENLAGIAGLGMAITLASEEMTTQGKRLSALRDRLIQGILTTIPDVRLNGHPTMRLPNHCSFSFKGVEGEALLLRLDLAGVAGSSGSACTSGSLDPSHVLMAIGLPDELVHGSLRLTLGKDTTSDEIDEVLHILPAIVQDLRSKKTF